MRTAGRQKRSVVLDVWNKHWLAPFDCSAQCSVFYRTARLGMFCCTRSVLLCLVILCAEGDMLVCLRAETLMLTLSPVQTLLSLKYQSLLALVSMYGVCVCMRVSVCLCLSAIIWRASCMPASGHIIVMACLSSSLAQSIIGIEQLNWAAQLANTRRACLLLWLTVSLLSCTINHIYRGRLSVCVCVCGGWFCPGEPVQYVTVSLLASVLKCVFLQSGHDCSKQLAVGALVQQTVGVLGQPIVHVVPNKTPSSISTVIFLSSMPCL